MPKIPKTPPEPENPTPTPRTLKPDLWEAIDGLVGGLLAFERDHPGVLDRSFVNVHRAKYQNVPTNLFKAIVLIGFSIIIDELRKRGADVGFIDVPEPSESKVEKIRHVREAGQDREHHCHWPGCTAQVPPAKWGCYRHWMMLPKTLRDRIWNAYSVGQEVHMTPSVEYVRVAREVQNWIKANYPETRNGG